MWGSQVADIMVLIAQAPWRECYVQGFVAARVRSGKARRVAEKQE